MPDSPSANTGWHGVERRNRYRQDNRAWNGIERRGRNDEQIEAELIATLEREIGGNQLVLPTLPEVALRVRRILADPDCSINKLAQAVSSDAAMTARLIKVTNSAAYRRHKPVEDVRSAITRLGLQLVRSMVTQLALLQSMRVYDDSVNRKLKKITDHSLDVAALCHALAEHYTTLNAEEALLAGLLHDIGKLPLIARMEQLLGPRMDTLPTDTILIELHTRVGGLVLRAWQFTSGLIAVAEEHHHLRRQPLAALDYTDLVIAANILDHLQQNRDAAQLDDAAETPVFRKLGKTPEQLLEDQELVKKTETVLERLRL